MSSKFYVRETKQKKTIYFEYRNEKIRFRSSTFFKVRNIKEWENQKCKLKVPSQPNAQEINEKLETIQNGFQRHLIENKNFQSITNEECRVVYDSIINELLGRKKIVIQEKEKEEVVKYDVVSYFDFYIDRFTKVPSESTKRLVKKDSMKSYKSAKKVLEGYVEFKGLTNLNFEDVIRTFYYDFIEYLYEKNYSTNYIGTIIKNLKTIMKSSFEFGHHSNVEFKKSYFSKIKEEINHPYLNLIELDKILNLKLDDAKDEIIRDIFIIQCNSGLRIEDLLEFLKNPHFSELKNGAKLLHKETNKTGVEIFAPLNKYIKLILDKRDGKLPPSVGSVEINKRIKEICRKAKITGSYTIKRTEGGVKKSITKPKCEFISTHTARRSFCTNAYLQKVPPHLIMLVSGHKSIDSLMLYIKVCLEEKVHQLFDYDFFK